MSLVEVHSDGPIGELVLNRPDKLNALSPQMLEEFTAGLRQLGSDPAVSVVIVRGEGRAFCVGYDVDRKKDDGRGHSDRTAYEDWERLRSNVQRWVDVWDFPKPVISAVHGFCLGGATILSVCTDLTVVAEDATIGWPTIPLGGGLLSPVSMWLVGVKKARELSYVVGSSFDGREAVALGWANEAVPAELVLDRARELARKVARTPPELLRLKKRALNRVLDAQGFRESLYFGAEWDALAHTSREAEHILAKVKEVGLKAAIAWFREGGDEPTDPRG